MSRRIIWMVALVVTIVSCANFKIEKDLKSFMKSQLKLTDDIFLIKDRNVLMCDSCFNKPVLVMLYDSTDCSECQINHLYDKIGFYDAAEKSGHFKIMTIFSPKESEYDDIMNQLVLLNFPYPLYIDFNGSFQKENYCIPQDKRFHCFLLDVDGYPVFVGNPLYSNEMMTIFQQVLATLDESICSDI